MIIDMHTHLIPQDFLADVRGGRFGDTVRVERDGKREWIATRSTVLGKERVLRNILTPLHSDIGLRLEDMDRMGVDRQIVSVSPALTFYSLEASLTQELAASMNDALTGLARRHPDKFFAMGTVPLQDPEAAAAELGRMAAEGHVGVQIASNIAGRNLGAPELDPFWAKAEELGFPVFVHPTDTLGATDRLKDFYLRNFIGNPLDTTIAAACLIFGGVLDRFPDLKVILAHLGGFTPWIRGRWQHGYRVREEPKALGAGPPEGYIGRFHYDTIIHDADNLEFGVRSLGADHVVYGTDYPADMANHQPAREIPGLDRLGAEDQEKILSGNTRRLYNLGL